uniref:Uncharacterized protein n=1 Tax=Anguilla anguilla TaxID=7936 RepID=A0A0E9UBK1_ANGAN
MSNEISGIKQGKASLKKNKKNKACSETGVRVQQRFVPGSVERVGVCSAFQANGIHNFPCLDYGNCLL